MDILEVIKTRRSIFSFTEQPVSKDLIEQIIEAGTWAPSHFRTEPWRFFVLEGDGRKKLGRTLAEVAAQSMDDPTSEGSKMRLDKIASKPLDAPVVIAVGVEPSDFPRAIRVEEYGAVNACIQNMLLAAHGLGLGSFWRTGRDTYDPSVKKLFGLSDQGDILGFISIGYPEGEIQPGKRKPYADVTTWITEDENL